MAGADLSDPQSWCLEKYFLGQFCVHFKISAIIIRWLSDESPFFPKKGKISILRQKTISNLANILQWNTMEPDSVTSYTMTILFMDWYANHLNEVNMFSALDNIFQGDC